MPPTLTLDQAAAVLNTTTETVSECIRNRGLPAARIGRAYVLVEADVIDWLRTQYPRANKQDDEEARPCASTHAACAARSGSTSPSTASALSAALAPRTGARRRNTRATLARDLWRAKRLGDTPRVTWDAAVLAWMADHGHRRSIEDIKLRLRWLSERLQSKPLDSINDRVIRALAAERKAQPVVQSVTPSSNATVNRHLAQTN
jgi:excisionase family DNA binding protein